MIYLATIRSISGLSHSNQSENDQMVTVVKYHYASVGRSVSSAVESDP